VYNTVREILTLGRTPVTAATSMAAARRLLVRPGVTGGAEEEDDADGRPGRWRVMTGVRSTFWALQGAPGAPRGSSYTVHMLDDHRTWRRNRYTSELGSHRETRLFNPIAAGDQLPLLLSVASSTIDHPSQERLLLLVTQVSHSVGAGYFVALQKCHTQQARDALKRSKQAEG
jgi:hypothetical protein